MSEDTVKVAVIKTERGTIKFALMEKYAPATVKNFVSLAESGYFNGLAFHRVVPGVLIQGGDPSGDGTGGPGYTIKAEFNELSHTPGAVGMARKQDPDSAGSQFYICIRDMRQLDRQYTVFGYVIEGSDVVSAVQKGDRMAQVTVEEVSRKSVPPEVLK